MKKILVCITDEQLFLLLRHIMATEGFDAVRTTDPDEFMRSDADEVSAVVLDWSLRAFEKHDLLDIAKAQMPGAAVILFCKNIEAPALEIPACDLLLCRPFEPARLLQFLRRLGHDVLVATQVETPQAVLRFADLEMNLAALTVQRAGRMVQLTALQFRLLRRLLQEPTTVVDRESLIATCWPGNVEVEPRTVDIHIAHIRRALCAEGTDLIRTVRGCGYALQMP